MRPTRGIATLVLTLLAGAILAAPGIDAQTTFQPAQTPPDDAQDQPRVIGQRLPSAEAPRWATCEAMMRDPAMAALFASGGGRTPYLTTRLPRNPDYSAPPADPPGSPLPVLQGARFGAHDKMGAYSESDVVAVDAVGQTDLSTDIGTPILDRSAVQQAMIQCRGFYTRGDGGYGKPTGFNPASSTRSESLASVVNPGFYGGNALANYANMRATIVQRDTTLPMGFALFDSGRYGESLEWFRKAAAKLQPREGGDEAALFVGKLYLQGLGAKSDPARGIAWLKKAATYPFNPGVDMPRFDPRAPERNTAVGEAAIILANVYRNGFKGIARDPAEARRWFERAFAVGHVPAAAALGDLYRQGLGVPRDMKKAVSWFEKGGRLGDPAAQIALAQLLASGEDGVAQDLPTALKWYQAAARSDQPVALYALARAYDRGEGVAADQQMALGFYKSAALRGNEAAMVALGTYFYEGKQVPKDDSAARKWFEAARDDPDGIFDLAAMMANGEGGARDRVGAWKLLRRAHAMGHPRAAQALSAVERRMTPDERAAIAPLRRG